MTSLRAVHGPATAVVPWLRATWAAGDAALVLPEHGTTTQIRDLLRRLRPATLTSFAPSPGPAGPIPLAGPAPPPETVSDLPEPLPTADDVRLVVATSGSTGEPKGVELTASALEASTRAGLARLGAHTGQRWALPLPLHHVAGIAVVRRAWALHTDPVLVPSRAALGEVAAQHLALVPTQLTRALDDGVDLARFATVLLGGAAAPDRLLERARDAGARVVVSYGMSETAGGCVYDGVPLDDVAVEVAADGRIRIAGAVCFRGYRGDPDATAAALDDDWLVTCDLGRWRNGRLEVLGRVDEVAVSGGENVGLPAVASAVRGHPDVADAEVTSRPDPEWGEAVVAVVVVRDGRAPPSLGELGDHVAAQLPASHRPRAVTVVDALPRDELGKVPRAALAALAADAR